MNAPGSESLRIVVFTAAKETIPMVEPLLTPRGHRLVGLLGAPGPRTRRTDDYLALGQYARPGLDVIISNYPNRWADMIRPLRPDLVMCLGFNWKIPADVLQVPRLGVINVHDGLLPKYRGRCAAGWALRNEDDFGFTVHYMSAEFDTGPVLAQRRINVTDDDHSMLDIFPRVTLLLMRRLGRRLTASRPAIPGRSRMSPWRPTRPEFSSRSGVSLTGQNRHGTRLSRCVAGMVLAAFQWERWARSTAGKC